MKINWFNPRMTGTEAAAVARVLTSGFINDGPVTAEFESKIADLAHRSYAVATTSGTVSLTMALMAAGLKHGEYVVVPDFTFPATANAVMLAGGVPVFADINRETFNLTAASIDKVRSQFRARDVSGRFVLATEVNGRGLGSDVLTYCYNNELILITDSCEALGSRWCGSYGVASCFSFSPNKLVTTGQGGAIATDDADLFKRLRELKYQGFMSRSTGADENPPSLGFNFKFTDIQAAIGLEQLEVFQNRKEACEIRDSWYRSYLAHIVEFPPLTGTHLWTDILTEEATPLATFLHKYGIGTRKFWRPLHRTTPYQCLFGEWPVADQVSVEGLWLPSSYDITHEEVIEVCDAIKAYMG